MEERIDSKLRIEHKDFIGIYENAVDPRFCDFIVDYMDKAEFVDFKRNFSHVKDKQICLDGFSPSESKQMMEFRDNFSEMVNLWVDGDDKKRVVICVDDLDRIERRRR